MDQHPFEFKITIIGMEVDLFVSLLKRNGYDNQAKEITNQFEEQLKQE